MYDFGKNVLTVAIAEYMPHMSANLKSKEILSTHISEG